jgi:hypothetical protein
LPILAFRPFASLIVAALGFALRNRRRGTAIDRRPG